MRKLQFRKIFLDIVTESLNELKDVLYENSCQSVRYYTICRRSVSPSRWFNATTEHWTVALDTQDVAPSQHTYLNGRQSLTPYRCISSYRTYIQTHVTQFLTPAAIKYRLSTNWCSVNIFFRQIFLIPGLTRKTDKPFYIFAPTQTQTVTSSQAPIKHCWWPSTGLCRSKSCIICWKKNSSKFLEVTVMFFLFFRPHMIAQVIEALARPRGTWKQSDLSLQLKTLRCNMEFNKINPCPPFLCCTPNVYQDTPLKAFDCSRC